MTNQIIPIFTNVINQEQIKLIDAKLLHSFLEIDTRFNDWISRRISEYGFSKGLDFYSNLSKSNTGGRSAREYHLTLDMAKELSMVERTEKGREARKYFIEREKQLMQILNPTSITIEQKYLIKKAVNERAYRTGEKHQTIYHKLYDYFKINSYEALPASKFDDAIIFISGKRIEVTENNVYYLQMAYNHLDVVQEIYLNSIEPALRIVNSPYPAKLHERIVDSVRHVKRVLNNLKAQMPATALPKP